ncbi:tetratricopeptide repeat protein [Chitinophaga agrisoli]|nr:tetratricopeptide repeat protein [Chitinophaga agrisoli]
MKAVRSCIIICCLIPYARNYAQGPSINDSLEKRISHHGQDTAMVNELLHLSYANLYNDSLSAFYYARKAIALSDKLKYSFGQVVGRSRLGDVYFQSDHYKEAYAQYIQARDIAQARNERGGLSIVYNELGLFHNSLHEFDKALDYLQRSLRLVRPSNLAAKGGRFLNIGVAYGAAGDYKHALAYLNKALVIYDRLQSPADIAFIYHNIGNAYLEQSFPDKALDYYNKALALLLVHQNTRLQSSTYLNMADVYLQQQSLEKAMQYIQQTLSLADKAGFNSISIEGRVMLSRILARKGQFRESEATLREIRQEWSPNMEQRKLVADAGVGLYRQEGNYRKAFDLSLQAAAVKDTLQKLANKKHMDLLEVSFQTSQHQAQIVLLQQQNKWKTTLMYFGAGAVLLCIVIIVILYYNKRLKEKVYQHGQKMLQDENSRILAERALIEEKSLRVRQELDHRNRELSANIIHTDQMNRVLSELREKLTDNVRMSDSNHLEEIRKLIRYNLELTEDWQKFKLHFEEVHPAFFDKLMQLSSQLSRNELKHCAYIRMNISNKEVASLLNVHPDSVKMSRYRIKKKLSLQPKDDLSTYILNL